LWLCDSLPAPIGSDREAGSTNHAALAKYKLQISVRICKFPKPNMPRAIYRLFHEDDESAIKEMREFFMHFRRYSPSSVPEEPHEAAGKSGKSKTDEVDEQEYLQTMDGLLAFCAENDAEDDGDTEDDGDVEDDNGEHHESEMKLAAEVEEAAAEAGAASDNQSTPNYSEGPVSEDSLSPILKSITESHYFKQMKMNYSVSDGEAFVAWRLQQLERKLNKHYSFIQRQLNDMRASLDLKVKSVMPRLTNRTSTDWKKIDNWKRYATYADGKGDRDGLVS
jgi:hypothetical protein